MMVRAIFFSLIGAFILFLAGCKKNTVKDDLNGEWIATDKSDTIYFIDDKNFYNSSANMHYDHYNYSVKDDSMVIAYSGKMYILTLETKHYFELNGDDLMIDFSNKQCFGFPLKKMKYHRVQKLIIE